MREIGSEFWSIDKKKAEEQLFLSGRTALEFIIRDIISTCKVMSVLLPSWCCHTMIEPFVRHGISVRFYDVYFEKEKGLCVHIPAPLKNEIFYYMTYFGSSALHGMDEQYVRKNWAWVISDDTHSWLGEKGHDKLAPDYSYISYRKWTGVYGVALARKTNGSFCIAADKKTSEKYTETRKNAARLKQNYMNGENVEKECFLRLYAEAEEMLEQDYVSYEPSVMAIEQLLNLDKQRMSAKRCENAVVLIDELSDMREISIVFRDLAAGDVPLFVPILVDEADRNELRKFLIDRNVYCPVHWSLSDYHNGISRQAEEIYYRELSLLCDQRYHAEDMKRIADLIREFYVGRKA